jgi:predicted short-subunit dehydrogenase-like oxidoreductase (DUF2520 family)
MIDRVTIVGPGRVGSALHRRCRDRGMEVHLVPRTGFDAWCASAEPVGQVLVIATKDDVLSAVAAKIAATRGADLRDVLVLHVNGSLGPEVLSPLHDRGAVIAAAHPFQTFGDDDPSALDGIGWGVACEPAAWHHVCEFVERTGGIPWLLTDLSHERKRRYHAAAVAASNFTYAAYELARRLAREADIPAEVFLVPIMERTFLNAREALRQGAGFAVTGPIVRGDVEGVQRQLEAIPSEDRDLYRNLARALLDVVSDTLDDDTRRRIGDVIA